MEHLGSDESLINMGTEMTTLFTCADDFLYFHTGDVYFFGKLVHSVVRVFVSERVYVDFDSWGN